MRLRIREWNLQAGDFKLNSEKPVGTGQIKSLEKSSRQKEQHRPNLGGGKSHQPGGAGGAERLQHSP